MARWITGVVVSLLFMFGLAAAQERVAVFDFEPVGIDPQTAETASRIFRGELRSIGEFTVMSISEIESKLEGAGITDFACYKVSCAAAYALEVSAEKAVIGSISRLGQKIVVEASLVSAVRKEILFSDQFTSSTIDDLDVVMKKMANAIAGEKKIRSEVDRFDITEDETMEPRRRKAYITSGASFGFGFPMGDSYSKVDDLKTLSWVMRYEADKYVIENSIGASWGSAEPDTSFGFLVNRKTITIVPWDIGMRYVFNREADFTPFLGGGLGFHFIAAQDLEGAVFVQSDQALALHLAGGVYAFQSYDFRLSLEGKYTMVFTDAFDDSGDSSQQFGISIGISRKFEKGEKRGCMGGGCMF